ncbi:MAG: PRD domain-containing protein [Erysipelotrichaceae bacterium]|nr:PRD domain-containing protein [Erysipelotrichaceae bacterium]
MKVIKNINNNIAHCLDSKGREVVAFGKGIGFFKANEEIPLERINRTFYNIKDTDYGIIRNIPTVIINTAIYIIDMVSDRLNVTYPSSKAISLADHLQFAIERKDKNIYLEQPILQDMHQLYPEEMRLAEEALKIIKDMTGEKLPRMEAGTLCLHFIADRLEPKEKDHLDTAAITENCTKIIEKDFSISIDRESFNYSRFVTHLDYLIRRLSEDKQIESENQTIFDELKKAYPDSYICSNKIAEYLKEELKKEINDEEVLYLVIHINRLISRVE